MMLKELFRFLPMLGWGTGGGVVDVDDRGSREQIAINTCLSAVQTYFPCDSTTDPSCLCEQFAWRVACYDNHASIPSSHHAHAAAETDMNAYCRAAGNVDALRQSPIQRRQLDSIFASIGGDIISFFKPPTPDATSAPVPTLAPAITTPRASAAQPTRAPASTPAAPLASVKSSAPAVPASSRPVASTLATQAVTYASTHASPAQTDTAAPSSSPTAAPPASSRPSTGLIVGVVFGILILLAAIGILAMLVLRHRRQSAATAPDAAIAEDRKGITQASRSEASMESVRTGVHGAGEKGSYYGHEGEPVVAHGNVGAGSLRGSRSEVWRTDAAVPHHVAEIDGREMQAPVELEARAPLPDCLRAGRGG